MPPVALVGHLFQVWTRVARDSPQKLFGMPDSSSIAVILLLSDQFALSATPFCYGQFWTVCCRAIPHSVVNCSNLPDMYSPPLSLCRVLMRCPDWFLAYALKLLKVWNTSDSF